MNKIRNIVFDLGGVIIQLDIEGANRTFESIGVSNAREVLNPYTQSGIFGDVESGRITAEEFQAELGRQYGKPFTFSECRQGFLGFRKCVPQGNLDALLELRRRGYRVILLSNTNPFMMSWADSPEFSADGHPVSFYFDAIYVSYKCGIMKPDERIFRMLLEGEGIRAEETLYLDDGVRNIEAASRLGISTLLVEDADGWRDVLFKRLGE